MSEQKTIELLSMRDAAARLGVCVRHLAKVCDRGELPTVRIGKRVLVSTRAIEQFIEAKENEGRVIA